MNSTIPTAEPTTIASPHVPTRACIVNPYPWSPNPFNDFWTPWRPWHDEHTAPSRKIVDVKAAFPPDPETTLEEAKRRLAEAQELVDRLEAARCDKCGCTCKAKP